MKTCQDHRFVFFGTSEFGAIILEKMVQAGIAPVLIVTTPDKPVGRKQLLTPPPVKILAERYTIPVVQPKSISNFQFPISKPDLFVVAAYGKVLPKEILDIPKHGALNVHPSLLPKYRGPSPIQTAILNGDQETGVTIILMDEKVDHGSVVASSNLKSPRKGQWPSGLYWQISNLAYPELHQKLAEVGADLLIKTVPQWIERRIKPIPQDDSRATYTKILVKEDGRIDWNKEAVYIERQVRALNPWPGTFTAFKIKNQNSNLKNTTQNSKMLKILEVKMIKENAKAPPGTLFVTLEKNVGVVTGEGALSINMLQLEGGKPISSKEFLLGHKNVIGTILS